MVTTVLVGYAVSMHVAIPISKYWLPISISVSACCLIVGAQTQLTMGLLQGFDQAQWDRERPETFVRLIQSKLQKHSRNDVSALLGPPDRKSDAGEGMFGPYQAYYSYILNCKKNKDGERRGGYTWHELQVSFSPDNQVSEIEVRSHAY